MSSPFVLVLVLGLIGGVVASLQSVQVGSRDVAWLAGGWQPSSQEGVVYQRYLRRHRVHRMVGAWFGVLLAVVYGTTWQGSVNLGIGQGSPFGDLLFCGVAGVMVGALSAETYRLAEPRAERALASLEGHPVPRSGSVVLAARVLLGLALVTGAVVLATARSFTSLGVALTAGVLVAVGEVTRAAVVGRRRPLLSTAAARVDRRIREYAWASVGHLELAAGALGLGWTVSKIPSDVVAWLQAVVVVGLLVAAVVALHRARPRPPRAFSALPQDAVVL